MQNFALKPTGRSQVSISYLEIYNEVGYDLLDPRRDIRGVGGSAAGAGTHFPAMKDVDTGQETGSSRGQLGRIG